MKKEIENYLETVRESLVALSTDIYNHPELAFEEHYSSQALVDFLADYGFETTKPFAGLDTAFEAVYTNGEEGPVIGVLAEYDALANGHSCGHNIIAASGAGAGIAIKQMLEEKKIKGTVKVIGTPAEEEGGGKVIMVENGGFDDLDIALLLHPTTGVSKIAGRCKSAQTFKVSYKGVLSSALSRPERGVNASEAGVLLHQVLGSALRYLPTDVRMMPFFTEVDYQNGLLPETTEVKISITADEEASLDRATERVKEMVEGVALITETTYEMEDLGRYAGRIINETVGNVLRENMMHYGEEIQDGFVDDNGIEDFGNVNRIVPGMMVYPSLMTEEKVSNHTDQFLALSDPKTSADVILLGSKVMAATALDFFLDTDLITKAQEELDAQK